MNSPPIPALPSDILAVIARLLYRLLPESGDRFGLFFDGAGTGFHLYAVGGSAPGAILPFLLDYKPPFTGLVKIVFCVYESLYWAWMFGAVGLAVRAYLRRSVVPVVIAYILAVLALFVFYPQPLSGSTLNGARLGLHAFEAIATLTILVVVDNRALRLQIANLQNTLAERNQDIGERFAALDSRLEEQADRFAEIGGEIARAGYANITSMNGLLERLVTPEAEGSLASLVDNDVVEMLFEGAGFTGRPDNDMPEPSQRTTPPGV